jgi:hypothetical protein
LKVTAVGKPWLPLALAQMAQEQVAEATRQHRRVRPSFRQIAT